ncbi:interleukin-21-like [Mixophyes fleayi]|uniref:interleukin-21-like n=1 Tax=Mixophyes fleayi TaxID=3061075 RepID=UPI003F4DDF58
MGKVLLYCMSLLALTALLHAALPNSRRCQELLKAARQIIQHANKTHPHSLHVPMEVKAECLDSALTCFRSQIPKLHEATGQSNANFINTVRKLKLNHSHEQKDCTPCSNYTTHRPERFMKEMEMLLQQIINLKL